jgi:hypothetical protein
MPIMRWDAIPGYQLSLHHFLAQRHARHYAILASILCSSALNARPGKKDDIRLGRTTQLVQDD